MNENPSTHVGQDSPPLDAEQLSRRDFLLGLGRWSKMAIGAAVLGGIALPGANVQAGAWINGRGAVRGGGWINGYGGGGSWANRRGVGGWING